MTVSSISPAAHASRDHRAFEEVGPELGEDPSLRDLAERVAGATDALQPAGDGLRRLDLDDQVHRTHVDAELERGGCDQAGELARLEQLLNECALLVGEGAVVGAGDFGGRVLSRRGLDILWYGRVLGCRVPRRATRPRIAMPSMLCRRELAVDFVVMHFVQPLGDPLGRAAVVDEDDRRVVLAHQAQQLGIDRRPDRPGVGRGVERGLDRAGIDSLGRMLQVGRRGLAGVGAVAALVGERAGLRHVLDRDDDLQVELLGLRGVDDLAIPPVTDQEPADPLQRPLGRRQADPLDLLVAEMVEPLEGQRQMGASLRRRHCVDLVDDHSLDAPENLAGARADHQIEGLGSGDQDVRRLAAHGPALGLRRIARAQRHGDRNADPLQRGTEVALDVVGEGLERRDVDDPHARTEAVGLAGQAVDPPQERGQGLARAGRSADQRVCAGRDRGPARRLGGGGCLERRLEPLPDRLGEGLQG